MLNAELNTQLTQNLPLLENDIALRLKVTDDENGKKVRTFVEEVASMSEKISLERAMFVKAPGFAICRKGEKEGIAFAGLPLGNQFPSFIKAMLEVSGYTAENDENLENRISSITKPIHFETYFCLDCDICPNVVQALNTISALNKNITHTAIESSLFHEEMDRRGVKTTPTIFMNGKEFSTGLITIEEILEKIG